VRHFTELELARWRETGPDGAHERIAAHVAECGACASRLAAVIRTQHANVASDEDAASFAAAGREIGAGQASVAPRRRWLTIGLPLAAAAAILLAFTLSDRVFWSEVDLAPRLRGGALQTISPSGPVDRDIRFTWAAGLTPPRFRIDVGSGETRMFSMDVDASPAALPPAFAATLEYGKEYWWTVAALDAGGKTVAVSERRAFSLRKQ